MAPILTTRCTWVAKTLRVFATSELPVRQLRAGTMPHQDSNQLRLDGSELEKRLVADFGIAKDKLTREILLQLLETLKAAGADVQDHSERYVDKMLVAAPWGFYTINVKKSTWTIIGLMLDLTLTMGSASAVLAASGLIGRLIGRLHEENGELCVYKFLLESKRPRTTEQIVSALHGECIKYAWECRFRKGRNCMIDHKALEVNLRVLESIGAISLTSNHEWKLEL